MSTSSHSVRAPAALSRAGPLLGRLALAWSQLPWYAAYVVAVVGPVGAALVRGALSGVLDSGAPLLVFVIPVVLAALAGGAGPGLVATGLGLLLGEYFFIFPYAAGGVLDAKEWMRLALFLFEGSMISLLGGAVQTQARLLRESEEQHRAFFELAGVGMIHVDTATSRIALANDRFCDMTGYSREELARLTLTDISHPDDWRRDEPRALRLFRGEIPSYETDKRYIHKDGRWVWTHVTASVIRGADGRIRAAAGVIEDVTEKEKAARELREAAARLSAVVGTAVDGIITIDERGTIETVNDAAVKIFGYEAEAMVGQNVRILMPEPYHSEHDQYLRNYLETGHRKIIGIGREAEGRRKDGSRFPLELAISESLLGDRRIFTGTVRDITARKEAESKLQELATSLEARVRERTSQLEDVNLQLESFAYTVSHDLRAPLRAVQGFARALLEDHSATLDAEGHDYAQRMVAAAARMDELIRELLVYSRLQRRELPLEPVSITDSVNTVLEQLRPTIEAANAELSVSCAPCCALANGSLLGQVLANLVSNALKFVNAGEKPRVAIRVEPTTELVRIWVEDNGIGIEPDHHERIFSVFERLHGTESYPGTGIGLAIVRKAMERLGGSAGVESTPGKGSRFWIELKRAAVAATPDEEKELQHTAG